jgi:hypothetical protein
MFRFMSEEVLAQVSPQGTSFEVAKCFRSTWIISSHQTLRANGLFERYAARLREGTRAELLEVVAGVWLPMTTARAHYEACERLGLSLDEQLEMGRRTGGHAQGTVLGTLVKAAKGAGVTPWTIMPHFDRLWRRAVDGGKSTVFRVGPKEARATFNGCELLDIPYFRNGLRGVLLRSGTLFAAKAYIHELPRRKAWEVEFRLQWA